MKNRHISNLAIEYNYLWPRHGPRPRKHRNDGDFPEFQRFGHRLAFTVADLPYAATGTLHSWPFSHWRPTLPSAGSFGHPPGTG